MAVQGVAQLAELKADLAGLAKQFDGPAQKRILTAVSKSWPDDAAAAASRDLGGDTKHSGWGIPLVAQVKIDRTSAVASPTRQSRGPWRVAEEGRNAGGGVGKVQGPGVRPDGTTRRNKSGMVGKVRRKTGSRRWNGYTRGKNTWSDARDRMATGVPDAVRTAVVKEVRGRFGRG